MLGNRSYTIETHPSPVHDAETRLGTEKGVYLVSPAEELLMETLENDHGGEASMTDLAHHRDLVRAIGPRITLDDIVYDLTAQQRISYNPLSEMVKRV